MSSFPVLLLVLLFQLVNTVIFWLYLCFFLYQVSKILSMILLLERLYIQRYYLIMLLISYFASIPIACWHWSQNYTASFSWSFMWFTSISQHSHKAACLIPISYKNFIILHPNPILFINVWWQAYDFPLRRSPLCFPYKKQKVLIL